MSDEQKPIAERDAECPCCGHVLTKGVDTDECCTYCSRFHSQLIATARLLPLPRSMRSAMLQICASLLGGALIGMALCAIFSDESKVIARVQHAHEAIAFDQGALAGMRAGIERYQKSLLKQTTPQEQANIINVILTDIKTNQISAAVWTQFHK